MADFEANFDVDKIFPKALKDENLSLEMVAAAQEIMKNAIQSGARKHVRTGKMANSIYKTKPVIDKNGNAVGRVKFSGSDGKKVSKNGQKFDRTNWIKAFRIEYGTSKQRAQPFVRPAIKSSSSAIYSAMKKIFDDKAGG
jgi:HK97 gp10 family phage protein